jgi:hypothetical protein
MVLRYQISGMEQRNNVLFDLPLFLVSHALNVGALDGYETIDDILGDRLQRNRPQDPHPLQLSHSAPCLPRHPKGHITRPVGPNGV